MCINTVCQHKTPLDCYIEHQGKVKQGNEEFNEKEFNELSETEKGPYENEASTSRQQYEQVLLFPRFIPFTSKSTHWTHTGPIYPALRARSPQCFTLRASLYTASELTRPLRVLCV